jgi:hypothetical protein
MKYLDAGVVFSDYDCRFYPRCVADTGFCKIDRYHGLGIGGRTTTGSQGLGAVILIVYIWYILNRDS